MSDLLRNGVFPLPAVLPTECRCLDLSGSRTPSELLQRIGTALGFPDAQIAAAPTGVTLSLAVGSPSTFAANPGTLRLDQASQVREIRHLLARGRLDPPAATARLLAVRDQAPRHPAWLGTLGWVICPPGIALILQPMWSSVAVATVAGIAVTALVRLSQRAPRFTAVLPVVAAFVVACIVFAAARHGLVEAPLRTLLAPLAVLLPGALLVTAMAELVTGHMVAGDDNDAFTTAVAERFGLHKPAR